MNEDSETKSAELIEVFSAIQGEGPIVGRRQIFVRFSKCDVKCLYCDTPLCHVENLPACRIEQNAGRRDFERVSNPVHPEAIFGWIRRLNEPRGRHHSVSWTGGEPLLHSAVIAQLGPRVRELGLRSYLETSGHLVDALKDVLPGIDIVGMDIKIPSTSGFAARFAENRHFLKTARDAGREVFVKIVIGRETRAEEIRDAVRVVADVDRECPVILQPVTPFRGQGVPPEPEQVIQLQDAAMDVLPEILVIPQTHKMIKQL